MAHGFETQNSLPFAIKKYFPPISSLKLSESSLIYPLGQTVSGFLICRVQASISQSLSILLKKLEQKNGRTFEQDYRKRKMKQRPLAAYSDANFA